MTHVRLVKQAEAIVREVFSRPGPMEALRVYFALVAAKDHPDDAARRIILRAAVAHARAAKPAQEVLPGIQPARRRGHGRPGLRTRGLGLRSSSRA